MARLPRFTQLSTLAAAALCLPFLGASRCVKAVYFMHEFEFDRCPPIGFELPRTMMLSGWRARAGEGAPYCHSFHRYELFQERGQLSDPPLEAPLYARLDDCRLRVAIATDCRDNENLGDCEKRVPHPGVHEGLKGTIQEYTELLAVRMVAGHPYNVKLPAAKVTRIGGGSEFEKWCAQTGRASLAEKGGAP